MKKRKYITFTQDRVILNEAINPKLQLLTFSVIAIFTGLQAWFWYLSQGADVIFWILGVLTVLLCFAMMHNIRKNSLRSAFLRSEIKEIEVRNKLKGKVLILKLSNTKQKILHLGSAQEIAQAIAVFKQEGFAIKKDR